MSTDLPQSQHYLSLEPKLLHTTLSQNSALRVQCELPQTSLYGMSNGGKGSAVGDPGMVVTGIKPRYVLDWKARQGKAESGKMGEGKGKKGKARHAQLG